MTTAQLLIDEETLVRETVEGIPLPEGIRFSRVVTTADFDGDPCWDVFFEIPKDVDPTEAFLKSMGEVRSQVHLRVSPLGTDRFPYVYFKEPR